MSGQKKTQTLASFFGVKRTDFKLVHPSEYAHVIIDAQRKYCDPDYNRRGNLHTKRRCETLARITPAFRQTGVQTAYVYFDRYMSKDFLNSGGGPFLVQVHREDLKIPKNADSAFRGASRLQGILEAQGVKGLIVSGFNTAACVKRTVIDGARAGIKIAVMRDAIGNDKYNNYSKSETESQLQEMADAGAKIITHRSALNFLSSLGPQ